MSTMPNGDEPREKLHAAVPASTLVLLLLAVPLLAGVLFGAFTHSTANALPDAQPSPTVTYQPVLTVVPPTASEPTATATTRAGSGGGGGGPRPTATSSSVPTAKPTATVGPVPTPPTGGG